MQTDLHARRITDVMSRYAAAGSNLSLATIAGAKQFIQWQHYPADDVIDTEHGTEFYYHAHPVGGDDCKKHLNDKTSCAEHGHFHVFCRSNAGRRFHHLVGISLNHRGLPTRLFLTNQWVTGETWVSADRACAMRSRFVCATHGRLAPVARWVSAMIQLYGSEIDALHRLREQWVASRAFRPAERQRLLRSRDFHVIAQTRINLIASLKNCLD